GRRGGVRRSRLGDGQLQFRLGVRALRSPLGAGSPVKVLVYESWRLDYPEAVYTYRWDGGVEEVTLGLGAIPEADLAAAPRAGVASLLAHLGVAFARYLLPLDDFGQLHVESLSLPPRGIAHFERAFRRGLAEMRYRNGLSVQLPFGVTSSPFAP